MSSRIFISSPSYAKDNREVFGLFKEAGIEVSISDLNRAHRSKELIERMGGVEGLLVFNTFDEVNREVILKASQLKVISRHGVGLENIDVKAAQERGIIVKNTTHANEEESVSDFAMGLLISCARNIPGFNNDTKKGGWHRRVTSDVSGKTVGILGLGKVGRCVARKAHVFNMRILACELYPDKEFCTIYGVELVDLHRLMRDSDFVTIHVPLTEETKGLIGKTEFELMKAGAFLINTARAQVLDSEPFYRVLVEHRIAGAAIDVYNSEPPKEDPLLALDNVIATPHVAALTYQVVRNMDREAALNIIQVLNPSYMRGKELRDLQDR